MSISKYIGNERQQIGHNRPIMDRKILLIGPNMPEYRQIFFYSTEYSTSDNCGSIKNPTNPKHKTNLSTGKKKIFSYLAYIEKYRTTKSENNNY